MFGQNYPINYKSESVKIYLPCQIQSLIISSIMFFSNHQLIWNTKINLLIFYLRIIVITLGIKYINFALYPTQHYHVCKKLNCMISYLKSFTIHKRLKWTIQLYVYWIDILFKIQILYNLIGFEYLDFLSIIRMFFF